MNSILDQHLTKNETNYFNDSYEQKKDKASNRISFIHFRDILLNFSTFNRYSISELIEKIKKDLIAKYVNLNEQELSLSEKEYYKHLNYLILESHRRSNEKDPEISNYLYYYLFINFISETLFNLLSNNKETLSKAFLVNIIIMFDLPISPDEFFAPIDKNVDNITFTDFCGLFRATGRDQDKIMNSFTTGLILNTDTRIPTNCGFPLMVSSHKGYNDD